MRKFISLSLIPFAVAMTSTSLAAESPASAMPRLLAGDFHWTATGPLVTPVPRTNDFCYSIKDPSIVRLDDRWHLFATIRSQKRSHQLEYLSFDEWSRANGAPRHILDITNGYFCAPQIFYFTPQQRWYL